MNMNSLRGIFVVGSVSLLLACGSSNSDGGTPSGSTCDPVAFTMLNIAGSDAKVCAATSQCIASQCTDTATKCAGPNYATGVYTGTCGAYFDCVKGCKCEKTCVDKCDPGTSDCASCLSIDLGMGCTLVCASEIASCSK